MKAPKLANLALLAGLALTACSSQTEPTQAEEKESPTIVETILPQQRVHSAFIDAHAPKGAVFFDDNICYVWNSFNDTFTFNIFTEKTYFGYRGYQYQDFKPYGSIDTVYHAVLVQNADGTSVARNQPIALTNAEKHEVNRGFYRMMHELTIVNKQLVNRLYSKPPNETK